ncbi:MAG: peptide chain release factor N(5)-glutamine methyltransferase [Thermoanaerobacterales bacterium]|nr:peptide chain release factor N(5)-glutamine methyltransferase [Thermoanaerobacterales bacterium]
MAEALAWARGLLRGAGVETAALDAEVLLAAALNGDRVTLYRAPERRLTPAERERFVFLVGERARRRPVAYLTGRKEFMGLEFRVTPDVLIPRPETEILVGLALEHLRGRPDPVALDVGTGSGAVAVSLAVLEPRARVWATDVSPAALAVARGNAARHGVSDRVTFLEGDLLDPVPEDTVRRADLLAANLPYVPAAEIRGLAPEVRAEPRLALDGGPDGLDLYRRLVPRAARLLPAGALALLEIAPYQAPAARALFRPADWSAVRCHRDLAGRERVIAAIRRG